MGFRQANQAAAAPAAPARRAPAPAPARQPAARPAPRGRAAPPPVEEEDYEDEAPPPPARGTGRAAARQPAARPAARAPAPPAARGGFSRPGAAPAARGGARARGGGGRGRFRGVRASEVQFPIPGDGNYFFQFISERVTDGSGPEWYNATLLVLDSDNPDIPIGSKCTYLQGVSGESAKMGPPAMKLMLMTMLGYAKDEEETRWADEFTEDQEEDMLESMYAGENQLRGEAALCTITRAKNPDFGRWNWEPCDPNDVPALDENERD